MTFRRPWVLVGVSSMLLAAAASCPAAGPPEAVTAPGAGPAAPSPHPAEATYPAWADLVYRTTATVMLMGLPMTLHGRATTHWQMNGTHYEMRLHTDTVEFDQSSQGALDPDGNLMPDRYEEKRPFHSAEAVDIDWAHERVQFGGAPSAHAPQPGAQDRLSLQFELSHLRQRYPERFVAGSTHEVHLIGTHDVDPWKFTVGETESIETGRGPMRAVRFSARRAVGTVEETMEIWLGEDLRWMPIRIRMVDRKQSIIDSVLEQALLP